MEDEYWQAIIMRDHAADRRFVYAVRTTGIYCRPSCPSPDPKRENVIFYACAEEAEQAGFRPCKRCKPQGEYGNIVWAEVEHRLDASGFAVMSQLLTAQACRETAALYTEPEGFRSRVIMERHNFGKGEYKYFSYPLPPLVASLRNAFYPPLSRIANRWHEAMELATRFAPSLSEFLQQCHEAGQTRPTPLLLQYGTGDYNCLHQDKYGELLFPLQMVVLLSEPDRDFTGGELVLTEQRPRMQSRPHVIPLRQGDAVIFAVNHRPVQGSRGMYRTAMRHGVSEIHTGKRHTLGVIFHDAE